VQEKQYNPNDIEEIKTSLDTIANNNKSIIELIKIVFLSMIIFASIVLLIQVILIIILHNKSKISDIQKLKNDINDTIDSFQSEMQNSNKTIFSGLEAKIPKLDAYASLINEKILVLRKDIEKLPSQFPKTANEDTIKNTINNKMQEIKTQLCEVGRLSENLQNIILINNNLKDSLSHQRSDLERREKSLEKEIALEKEMVKQETTTALKKTFDSEKTGLSLKVNSLTSNNEKLSQELIKAKTIVGKYEEVEHQRQEAKTQLETEIRKNEKLAAELATIQNNIQERLHTKEIELESQIENRVKNEIDDLKMKIDKKDIVIEEKDNIIKNLKERIDNAEKIILLDKTKIAEFDSKITDNKQKIEAIELEKKDLIDKNNLSKHTLEEKTNEISKLNQTIKKNKEEYDYQIADKLQTIDSLNTEYEKQNQLMQELETKIYPDIFNQDSDFINLKNHLQQWIVDKIGTTGIIISNLNILALRESMNADSWKLALKNVSLGITLTMRQSKISERQIIDELVSWGKFLMKYSNDKYPYTIQIPKLGDNVDTSWMTAKNNSVVSVNKVLSWAVFHNQYGVQHNAEVE
jgi:chromosome segregation ATPase